MQILTITSEMHIKQLLIQIMVQEHMWRSPDLDQGFWGRGEGLGWQVMDSYELHARISQSSRVCLLKLVLWVSFPLAWPRPLQVPHSKFFTGAARIRHEEKTQERGGRERPLQVLVAQAFFVLENPRHILLFNFLLNGLLRYG